MVLKMLKVEMEEGLLLLLLFIYFYICPKIIIIHTHGFNLKHSLQLMLIQNTSGEDGSGIGPH